MTNRLTTQEIEAIRKRAEQATEGPWVWGGEGERLLNDCGVIVLEPCADDDGGWIDAWDSDEDFIANARTDIPKLLAEVEALQKVNGEYERALSQIAHGDTWTAYPHDIAAWALGLK